MNELALIVEDDIDLAEIFDQSLRSAHFNTEILADGEIALKRIDDVVPHLVLLDIHLPGASGETFFAKVRADPRLEKTIIIIATADARMADQYRESTADFILIKPISFGQLRDLASRLHDYYHGSEKFPDSGTIPANKFRK
jgi:DNA-binding response OmpR family regulator